MIHLTFVGHNCDNRADCFGIVVVWPAFARPFVSVM